MERPKPLERLDLEPEPDVSGSLFTRIGFVVAGGVGAAVASALPASLRMGEDASVGRALEQWLVLSALATPIAVVLVVALRRARFGLDLLIGPDKRVLASAVLWWSVIELGLLSVFGALLRKTTHHHALAGVTFAAFAFVSGVLVAIFAQRTTRSLARGGPALLRTGLVIAGIAAGLVVLLVGVRTARAEGLHTAAALLDGLVLAVTALVASGKLMSRVRPLAIAGVPAAILLLMVGLTTLRFDPALQETLPRTAPLHAALIELFR